MIVALGFFALAAGVLWVRVVGGRERARVAPPAHVDSRALRLKAERRANALGALALLWAECAVLALFFVPMGASESVSSTSDASTVVIRRSTTPLITSSAAGKVLAVAVAIGVFLLGLRLGRPPRWVLVAAASLSMVFCLLAMLSIGVYLLPVPLLLLAAAATAPPEGPTQPHATGGSTR